MKIISIISAIFFSLLFTLSCEAATLQKNIGSCTNFSQYFKFRSSNTGLFTIQKNINVNTTLANQTLILPGDSKVYLNKFTADTHALLAGQTSTTKALIECTILFDCICTGTRCASTVTTLGALCSSEIGGQGTESDPYVFNFK